MYATIARSDASLVFALGLAARLAYSHDALESGLDEAARKQKACAQSSVWEALLFLIQRAVLSAAESPIWNVYDTACGQLQSA
jgi:hypothetical protein